MNPSELIKKRILVVGANGMLGQRVLELYSSNNDFELLATSVEDKLVFENIDYVQSDISNRNEIKKAIYDFCPDFIINAAAYTNVDKSESERDLPGK